ncbi:SLC13 family permease [Pseudorhodoferax sp.]|uniref:SLC13 family permease n=1 Tax=Pseudorhodoferax sp. TaxID=1993553 RepID=UPI002DD645D7|nr:SLC13 family permease [Pseudorhodoferax sp.]
MIDFPHSGYVLAIFGIVYLGMMLGGLPRLHLDRTGVALLGAIAIIGAGEMSTEAAARSVHLPTIVLLFSFMVISAQMRLGGFYAAVTRRLADLPLGPRAWLAVVIAAVAALSAVFTNDIICLAMAPVLVDACQRRRLDPVPYLLALACASNIGSAATLIGNPQNMLLGEVLGLPFGRYTLQALPPVLASLGLLWALLAWQLRRGLPAVPAEPAPWSAVAHDSPDFDAWQTGKGLVVALVLMGVFLLTGWPRDVAALVGAGLLLLSQRFHSSRVMGQIDWELLVLFIGLFVVNHALEHTGLTAQALQALQAEGVDLRDAGWLFGATALLSNLVSNVPAVMLLLPAVQAGDTLAAGTLLALVSTLAGNLLIVGSIANIIVVDAARRRGVQIDWLSHLRIGLPVTLGSLLITALWLGVWRVG